MGLDGLTVKREKQELLTHPAWARFKVRVLAEAPGSLKHQLQVKLEGAGREGDGLKCKGFASQIEILTTIFKVAEEM